MEKGNAGMPTTTLFILGRINPNQGLKIVPN